jgi:hypothetical protein
MPSHDDGNLGAILTHLRRARRHLAESTPGSPDFDRLAARVHDLEDEYRAAIRAGLRPTQKRQPAHKRS